MIAVEVSRYDQLKFRLTVFTARKRSLRRLCFYRCVSVHRGWGGMRGRGGVCMAGGGACVADTTRYGQ